MSDIYKPLVDLRYSQLHAVADRRFDDAVALSETSDNARANGVQYLAGLVIEISLKAQLVRQYPTVARQRGGSVRPDEQIVWNLVWRSHDLTEMLAQLPELISGVRTKGSRAGKPYLLWLQTICFNWTIFVRYTTQTSMMTDAKLLLDRVRQLKEVLR